MPTPKILVVGTTDDYIEKIRNNHPGRALFITDVKERKTSLLPCPDPAEELKANLEEPFQVAGQLKEHLKTWNQVITGVTAFDCESLSLASRIAREFGLSFPGLQAVELCRDKLKSKEIWRRDGLACPRALLLDNQAQVGPSRSAIRGPVILKPLSGAGSELVFKCNDPDQARQAYGLISERLARHPNRRLFHKPGNPVLMEEFICGDEFSCDFLITEKTTSIIRLARKYHMPNKPAGTIRAYMVPAPFPQGAFREMLESILFRAAKALGLSNTICMTDFIMQAQVPFLLEMTPRPGGDCLPDLIQMACGLDMLGLCLDLAEGKIPPMPIKTVWRPLVGLRLFSRKAGTITELDAEALRSEPGVLKVNLNRRIGDHITLPPENYDSHILGQVIFEAPPFEDIERKLGRLESLFNLKVE